MIRDSGRFYVFQVFFFHILPGWSQPGRQQAKNAVEWVPVFDSLIRNLRADLLEAGNEILCLVARNDCLVLIKMLFEAGNSDPELRTAVLADTRKAYRQWKADYKRRAGEKTREGLDFHQSIGEAVWEGHTEVVDFLSRQPGTEHHLRYVNQAGRTVFHQWARNPNKEIFRILIRQWPEGVHLRNVGNDTLVSEFLFNAHWCEDEIIEYVDMLIREGNVDTSGGGDDPWYTPLRVVARRGQAKVCRFLITEGSADIHSVLGVDETTAKPFLFDQSSSAGDQKVRDEERMLRELCSLVPLAVPMDYLS
jgi:hypothetical protein